MNVVVSAIVDPWVTTLSFVVALTMRIQEAFYFRIPFGLISPHLLLRVRLAQAS